MLEVVQIGVGHRHLVEGNIQLLTTGDQLLVDQMDVAVNQRSKIVQLVRPEAVQMNNSANR